MKEELRDMREGGKKKRMIGNGRKKDWNKIVNIGIERWKWKQEGGKTRWNLNELSSTMPFAVTAFTVKFYKFNT